MEPSVQPNIPNEQVLSSGNKPGILKLKPKIVILAVLVLIIVGSLAYYFYSHKVNPFQKPFQKPISGSSTSPVTLTDAQNKAVARVGQETIYQSDLDKELASQPPSADPNLKRRMLQKIATDSAILQGAREIALVKLDDTVFNSKTKDYQKRLNLVKEAKEKVTNEADSFEGTIISIWFLNGKVGALGYEQAKQIAFDKISKLYADVKSRKMTIAEASDNIKNDSSLAQIDPAYKTNASLTFKVSRDQKITSDLKLNAAIFKLTTGQLTEIFTGSSPSSTGQTVETRFHFAQLNKRTVNDKLTSFENWLDSKRKAYAITYY